MRVALLGLGLIGGSIARALRADASGGWSVAAWTPRGSGPRIALEQGVIDQAAGSPEAAIDGAELVVLAAPPLACLDLLRDLAGPLHRYLAADAVITDVASTKREIVGVAERLGLRFVGGHPMAGRELAGFEAADASLFSDRPWILVEARDADAMSRVEGLAGVCHARVVQMTAEEHDRAVAAISHLPLVLSAALVEAVAGRHGEARPDWSTVSALAAGGWESLTRLARGDVEMGTGIAVTNAADIAARLRDLRAVVDSWLDLLEREGGPDEGSIRERLASARAVLEDEA